jgi:hypothetical protein
MFQALHFPLYLPLRALTSQSIGVANCHKTACPIVWDGKKYVAVSFIGRIDEDVKLTRSGNAAH